METLYFLSLFCYIRSCKMLPSTKPMLISVPKTYQINVNNFSTSQRIYIPCPDSKPFRRHQCLVGTPLTSSTVWTQNYTQKRCRLSESKDTTVYRLGTRLFIFHITGDLLATTVNWKLANSTKIILPGLSWGKKLFRRNMDSPLHVNGFGVWNSHVWQHHMPLLIFE